MENVEAARNLLEYGVTRCLNYDFREHPLLLIDGPFAGPRPRAALCRELFEHFEAPAVYFTKAPSCIR